MRQDILLVSNASMDLYAENKLGDFRVRLPKPLYFDKSYRVAVTRVSFTKSYFNYDYDAQQVKLQVILSDTKEPYVPSAEGLKHSRLYVTPLAGYYTPETFLKMLNTTIDDIVITGDDELISHPLYDLKNGYVTCDPGKFKTKAGNEVRWEVSFDPITKAVLGMDRETQRPVFVNQSFTDLYLFSDLVFPTILGDQTSELMCILDGQTAKPFGTHCSEVFEDPWYLPLARQNIEEIHCYIRTDTGAPIRFFFGRVTIRLSFRKEDDL